MAIKEEKKSFIMYVDYQYDFEVLTGDECKELMMLIFNYERTGKIPNIDNRFMKMTFNRIQRDLDRNDSAWMEKKILLSEAGKRGAEKRWHSNDNHPIASDSHPTTPLGSMPVNDNVNVNDNVLEATVLNEPRFIDSDESISDRIIKEIKEKEEMKIKSRNMEDIYSEEFIETLPF